MLIWLLTHIYYLNNKKRLFVALLGLEGKYNRFKGEGL
jgi:hypothetical protein